MNDLVARTFVMPERLTDGPIERWGVQLRVQAGIRTFIRRIRARGELVEGEVMAGDDENSFPVNAGTVRVIAWPRERPEEQEWFDGFVQPDGSFRVILTGRLVGIHSVPIPRGTPGDGIDPGHAVMQRQGREI